MTVISVCYRYCIKGLLSGKIVLLTTHNTRYFQEADQIVYLREGKHEELKFDAPQREMLVKESVEHDKEMSEDNKDECHEDNERNDKKSINQDVEERGIGRVTFKVYKEYFAYGAYAIVCFIVALVYFSGQGKKIEFINFLVVTFH